MKADDIIVASIGIATTAAFLFMVIKHARDISRAMRFRIRLEILVTRRNAYQSENALRDRVGQSIAYGEDAFFGIERELKSLVSTFERGKELIP